MTPQPASSSPTAQPLNELALRAAVVPGSTEVAVTGARPGEPVVVFLGVRAARTPLPGGAVVDLVPEVVAGFAPADAHGNVACRVGFAAGRAPGAPFFAQAVAARGTIGAPVQHVVSALQPLRVPAAGDAADVLLLFGQSNAEGSAAVAGLPAALRGPLPGGRIWNALTSQWQAVQAGVNNTTLAQPAWCGPELTLLDGFARDGRVVYLVKFAVGQTSLGPNPGPWNEWDPAAGELYAELLRRLDGAVGALLASGLVPRVRGICMMQGESDALSMTAANGYAARLRGLIGRLRADLVARQLVAGGVTPFVFGQIDARLPAAVFPGTALVRAAQATVVDELPGCDCLETSGMPRQADQVHLDTQGVQQLGQHFVRALRRFGV